MIDIKPTTLLVSNHNRKITVEIPWDADLYEFVDACKTLALGMGYNPETWNDVIVNLAHEISESDNDYDNTIRFKLTQSVLYIRMRCSNIVSINRHLKLA